MDVCPRPGSQNWPRWCHTTILWNWGHEPHSLERKLGLREGKSTSPRSHSQWGWWSWETNSCWGGAWRGWWSGSWGHQFQGKSRDTRCRLCWSLRDPSHPSHVGCQGFVVGSHTLLRSLDHTFSSQSWSDSQGPDNPFLTSRCARGHSASPAPQDILKSSSPHPNSLSLPFLPDHSFSTKWEQSRRRVRKT